ncbi:helix-turn-helix domain-containing protein [Streptomyces sp. N2-109]|uniref:Helix-turn-helix domain-containing protein n=1 Tax=Streptomyces gossypii TaxID=2883101 RepID=A0ABT2JP52_9ACTN|nr:helix-turn-helix domain-containing protein [Streptomyces gossypii]MCT2589663.1 helix-turn-helix domain-containing protein [Streptomyces gossypii]
MSEPIEPTDQAGQPGQVAPAEPAEPAEPTGPKGRPDPETDVVLDARGLRALAHPVRVQLLGLLRKHGPSTATRLAERLGVNSGTASYHLRQLGAAEFVEEDTERGNARERWWRSRHRTTWFRNELAREEPEAAMTYFQSIVAMDTMQTQRVLGEFATMPHAWQQVVDLSSYSLRLTPEEAEALGAELTAVVRRYRPDAPENAAAEGADTAHAAAAGAAPEYAERVTVNLHVMPEPGIEPPPHTS